MLCFKNIHVKKLFIAAVRVIYKNYLIIPE